jgi:hypothetical protein
VKSGTISVDGLFISTVTSTGQVMVGAVMSLAVSVTVQSVLLPATSVTVIVTNVVSLCARATFVPAVGDWVIFSAAGQLSEAVRPRSDPEC